MSNVLPDLQYTKTHEWVRTLPDGTVEIGIPEGGRTVALGEPCAVVESVKAASDVYSPVAGEITLGNPLLAAEPEAVNNDPYGKGWLMRLRPTKGAASAELMAADDYRKLLQAEGG
jgi:glycine cleavage system H protein